LDHHIKPSDIAAWDDPDREVTGHTQRLGREKEWFALIGRVAGVKAEEDGDLHIELRDADNPHGVRVVVEVPLDRHGGKTPWNPIRQTVFGWSDQTFPFDTRTGHRLHLVQSPVVRVVGMAFYDAKPQGRPTQQARYRGAYRGLGASSGDGVDRSCRSGPALRSRS
jgi:hypothetical protein